MKVLPPVRDGRAQLATGEIIPFLDQHVYPAGGVAEVKRARRREKQAFLSTVAARAASAGSVPGAVLGNASAEVPRTVSEIDSGNFPGTVPGTSCGIIPGTFSGKKTGNVPGPVPGTCSAIVPGIVPGTVSGTVSGTVPGNFSGTVSAKSKGLTPPGDGGGGGGGGGRGGGSHRGGVGGVRGPREARRKEASGVVPRGGDTTEGGGGRRAAKSSAINDMLGNRLGIGSIGGRSSNGGGGSGGGGGRGGGGGDADEELPAMRRSNVRGGGVEDSERERRQGQPKLNRRGADDALIFTDRITIARANNADDSDSNDDCVRYIDSARGERASGGGRVGEDSLPSTGREEVPTAIVTSSVSVVDMGALPSPSK